MLKSVKTWRSNHPFSQISSPHKEYWNVSGQCV